MRVDRGRVGMFIGIVYITILILLVAVLLSSQTSYDVETRNKDLVRINWRINRFNHCLQDLNTEMRKGIITTQSGEKDLDAKNIDEKAFLETVKCAEEELKGIRVILEHMRPATP